MDFLSKLLQGIAFVPSVVNDYRTQALFEFLRINDVPRSHGIRQLQRRRDKRDRGAFCQPIGSREEKRGHVDGTVLCLNASTWAKPTQP
jgi:hypothetical protein